MKTYKVTIDGGNTIRWFNDKDELHREDGPAVEYANGTENWFFSGIRHREDGPAVVCSNGYKAWYLNGKFHREGGPAIIYSNGGKAWCFNGLYHREDGPAIENTYNKEWYLHGKEYSEVDFLKETSKPACTRQTITIEGRDYILVPK